MLSCLPLDSAQPQCRFPQVLTQQRQSAALRLPAHGKVPGAERFGSGLHPYPVQDFERARFEYDPEFAGTPHQVELGLLGNVVLQEKGWLP